MTTRVINAAGSYRVVPGDLWRTSALLLAPLLDEWTAAAPTSVTARCLSPGADAHVTAGHLVITGRPEVALPSLAVSPTDLLIELRREGRPAQLVTVTVPAGAALPHTAPAVTVASTVIRLQGRVTADAFPHGPVAGASVTLAGVGVPLMTLPVPLALPHAAGTTVRVRTPAAGATTTLAAPARGGERTIAVASTAGIAPGTLLAIRPDPTRDGELVVADGTAGTLVLLRTPIAASTSAGATVAQVAPGVAGATATLTRDALAGDGLLPLAAALAGVAVEIVDGLATEFRFTPLLTDADGRWALPGVRGVPEVTVTVAAATFLTHGPRRCPLAPVDPFVINTALRT